LGFGVGSGALAGTSKWAVFTIPFRWNWTQTRYMPGRGKTTLN